MAPRTISWYCPSCGYRNTDVIEKGKNLVCGYCDESFHPDTILKLEDTEIEEEDDE